MSRSPVFFAIGLLVSAAFWSQPSLAQGRQLFGARDFEMDWQVEPGMKQFRVRFLAQARMLRVEILDGSAVAMIKDLARGDIQVLISEGTRGRYAAKGPVMGAFNGTPQDGTREIAGQACRDFDAGPVVLCLSDDGIPLRIAGGEQVITTTRLLRQAQSPALFLAPNDAKVQPLPGGIGSALPRLPF